MNAKVVDIRRKQFKSHPPAPKPAVSKKTATKDAGNLSSVDSDFTLALRARLNARVRDALFPIGKDQDKISLEALLEKCEGEIKTPRTISRLAYYETTNPSWRTIWAVVKALNMEEEVGQMMIEYGRKRHNSR